MKLSRLVAAMMLNCTVLFASASHAQTSRGTAFDSRLTLADWDYDDAGNLLRLAGATERQGEIEAAAAEGNADALTLSGLSQFFGLWGPQDKAKGWAQIVDAANKGHVRAMAIVAMSQWDGTLVTANQAEAVTWMRKAADAGSGLAQGNLALLILEQGVERLPEDDPVKLMEAAADKGVAWAANAAGNIYIEGVGVPKNETRARQFFERAARLGDINGLSNAGTFGWAGERESLDTRLMGIAKMDLAARSGEVTAMKIVSGVYLGTTAKQNQVDFKAATTMLEAARKVTGGKDKQINQMLSDAKAAVAREKAGVFGIGYGLSGRGGGGQQVREPTSAEIVNTITITEQPWPEGVPAPTLPSIKGDRSKVDEWGVSEREWREMSAEQFTAFVMTPTVLRRVAEGYAKRDPKAMTLVSIVSHVDDEAAIVRHAFPQCKDIPSKPEFCIGLSSKLRDYLTATGIGRYASRNIDGFYVAEAIAEYLIGQPSMRAQLEGALGGLYNDHQRRRMLVFADLGYLPAIQHLERVSGSCRGMAESVAFLDRMGRNRRELVDAAMALGDSETGFQYGRQLRDGSCVTRDSDGAAKLFRVAADMGNIDAKYELMMMYGGYAPGNFTAKYREAVRLAGELQAKDGVTIKPELLAQFKANAVRETAERGAIGDVTDDPSKAPNPATIRAVVMREQRQLLDTFSGISFMSLLGNPPLQSWNYDDGSFLFETQNPNDMFAIYYRTDYWISSASCIPVVGAVSTYDCSYSMSASMDYRIGKSTLFNGSNGKPKAQKHRFEFSGGQWRSLSLRTEMMANMPTNGIGATGGSNNNGLCKSLYAGVVAVGGKSTDKSLEPSTWGC